MVVLDANKQLQSDLWLDQPDAVEQIARRERDGELSAADAEALRAFTSDGYLRLHLDIDDDFAAAYDAEVDRLWRERPFDLFVGLPGGGRRSISEVHVDGPALGYRIADMHGHSDIARWLYLNPEVMRMVELIYGEPALAFQSLAFHYGSQQGLHRDPMFVLTNPPSHLLAAWIALEDVSEKSGPLLYVPGSHRMPWVETRPGKIGMPRSASREERQRWVQHRSETMREMGLEVRSLTCERGDVFIWHAGLLHGGKKLKDPSLTRKSFVTHYCTAAHYESRSTTAKVAEVAAATEADERLITVRSETRDHLREGGYVGLQAPLRGLDHQTAVEVAREQRRQRRLAREAAEGSAGADQVDDADSDEVED